MNGNCHLMFGTVCGAMLACNLEKIAEFLPMISSGIGSGTLLVMGGAIGSILPDIDNGNSYVGKLTVPVSTVINKIGKAFGKTDRNHRGIFHDPAVYIAGLILSYLYFTPLIGLFMGCITHILLDMFNPSGVPFLFGVKRLRLAKIVSGSKESNIFTWIVTGAVLLIGIIVKIL